MKIGIVFVGDIAFCPYLAKYKEMCEEKGVEYDVIYWNRSNDQTNYPDNYLAYNLQSNLKQSKHKKAKDYLDYSAFSEKGLKEQLEYEGYTEEEAAYGVEKSGGDWMEQAEKKAKDYMDYSSFSKQGLIDQLIYEGFTQEQAEHGAESVGY